jgi:hypothetical protein
MAIKKRILHRAGKGSATMASPALISLLAEPGNIETTVRLAARVGVASLDNLDSENAQDVAEGVEILRRLWTLHHEAAVAYCVKHYGPGRRPALWWDGRNRPYVPPRNWALDDDLQRFEQERVAADLEFLKSHKLLSRVELRKLGEAAQPQRFGPEEEDGN